MEEKEFLINERESTYYKRKHSLFDNVKTKNLFSSRTIKREKRQAREWKKIYANHVANKGYIF